MKRKWFLKLMIISISSVQLAFGEALYRRPSSNEPLISVDEFLTKVEVQRTKIKGKELPASCDEESKSKLSPEVNIPSQGEISLDYQAYLKIETEYIFSQFEEIQQESTDQFQSTEQRAENVMPYSQNSQESYLKELNNLKQNACGQYLYKITNNQQKESNCQPVRVRGLLEEISSLSLSIEKEDSETKDYFENFHKKVIAEFNKANVLKEQLLSFLNESDLSVNLQRDLLEKYLYNVVMPLRDLTVVTREYYTDDQLQNDRRLAQLLPIFNSELYKKADERAKQNITMGLHPSLEQNFLSFKKIDTNNETVEFNKNEIIQRDILSLLKAPTAKNYVIASKWFTLHMITKQLYTYKVLTGDYSDVEIPRSCQNHFNGNMPAKLKFEFTDRSQGEQFLNSIIQSHGLVYSENNPHYIDYYMNNLDIDPLKDGYKGLAPFEELKHSVKATSEKRLSQSVAPRLNDYTHFDQIISYKKAQIDEIYKKVQSGRIQSGKKRNVYEIDGKETVEKILSRPPQGVTYEIPMGSGEADIFILDPFKFNLSTYLAEKMQREMITNPMDLLSVSLRQKLLATPVAIKFPSLYSSNAWRRWALVQLSDFFEEYSDASIKSDIHKAVTRSCMSIINSRTNRNKNTVCSSWRSQDLLKNLSHYLKQLIKNNDFLSIQRLNEEGMELNWDVLAKIWNYLRDRTDLFPIAKTSEFNFIEQQMEAKNSWAMARLGYLVHEEEFVSQKENFTPVYVKNARNYKRYDSNTSCFYGNLNVKLQKLQEVGELLGLDKGINIDHAETIISDREKELIWKQIRSTYNERTSNLITQKIQKKPAYEYLDDISYESLLSPDSVRSFAQNKKMNFLIDEQVEDEWDEYFSSHLGRRSSKLLELYKMKGSYDDQLNAFEDFSRLYNLDNPILSKLEFLIMDTSVKGPLYKRIIREAANKRKLELQEELEHFCNLRPDNHEKIQAIFHQTTVNQLRLNQMAGLSNAQMDKITDKINSLSPDEWKDMAYGFGAAILAIAAIGIGTMCTGVTGGLCAPLGVAMVGAGLTGMGLQLELFNRELGRKIQADELEVYVKRMEDLGFASEGSANNVSRGWTWSIIEAISIIPLIGAVSKSVGAGTRMTIAATHALMKETSRKGLKGAWQIAGRQGRAAMLESDILMAQFVAGQRTLLGDIKDAGATTGKLWDDVRKIRSLRAQGKISRSKMFGMLMSRISGIKNVIRYTDEGEHVSKAIKLKSAKESDRDIAKTFVKYWGKDLRSYYSHIRGIWGKWSISSKWRGNRLKYAEHVMKKVEKGEFLKGTNWIQRLRYEHLAQVAPKLRNLRRSLRDFANNGQVVVKTSTGQKTITNAEDFVLHFMEDMTDIHMKMGMRAKELPYMFIFQGGPHTGGFFGKRVPNLLGGYMGDNFLMRKLFNARARLYYEAQKEVMKKTLQLPKYVGTDSVMRVFNAFTKSVNEAAYKQSAQESAELLKRLAKYKWSIAKRAGKSVKVNKVEKKFVTLLNNLANDLGSREKAFEAFPTLFNKIDQNLIDLRGAELAQSIKLTDEKLAKILFQPQTESEKTLAEIIWQTIPTDDLFAMKGLEGMAHNVAKQLSDYKTADEFDQFLNALKLIVVKRDPGIVEIF